VKACRWAMNLPIHSTNVRMGWRRLDTDESVYYDIYFGTSPNPPFLGG